MSRDDGPLWSQDSAGYYWLMFPNFKALTMEEIQTIFSEYGQVRKVTKSGDEKGHRFVQYSKLEDTERAIEGLKNHPSVSLRPHRPKNGGRIKSSNNNSNNDDNDKKIDNDDNTSRMTNGQNDDCRRNMYQRKNAQQHGSIKQSDRDSPVSPWASSAPQRNDNDEMILFKKVHNFDIGQSIDNLTTLSSRPGANVNYNDNDSLKNYSSRPSSVKNSNYGESKSAHSAGDKMFAKLKNICTPPSFRASCIDESMNIDDYEDCDDDSDMPELVTSENIVPPKPKMMVFQAGEIVVGNIDPNFGAGYMLHLFENYEPIAVGYIKTVRKTGLRYCHVYFKNWQDSVEVETRFDNYKLAGKNLIVMRPCKMLQEADLQ